jgi:hypothetical protein
MASRSSSSGIFRGEIGPREACSDDVRGALQLVRDFSNPVFEVTEKHRFHGTRP